MFRVCTVLVLAAVALSGCAGKITGPTGDVRAAYAPTDRVRVMLAVPGPSNDAASRAVAQRVIAVLQQSHGEVALLPTINLQEAMAAAREANAKYLICPTIEEWYDGMAPPFTADRIKVRLDLRDVANGDVVDTVTFSNVAMFSVSDQNPDALLDKTFERAVGELVGSV